MKKRTLLLSIFAAASILACKDKKETETVMATNPFYETFDTPYELPPFEKITQADLKEAIEKGIAVQKDEIDAIAQNPEKATWENTILALENSGRLLKKSRRVFSNLNSANTNAELQAMDLELAPKLSAHQDDIYMNQALFERIAAIYEPDKNPEMPISFSNPIRKNTAYWKICIKILKETELNSPMPTRPGSKRSTPNYPCSQ